MASALYFMFSVVWSRHQPNQQKTPETARTRKTGKAKPNPTMDARPKRKNGERGTFVLLPNGGLHSLPPFIALCRSGLRGLVVRAVELHRELAACEPFRKLRGERTARGLVAPARQDPAAERVLRHLAPRPRCTLEAGQPFGHQENVKQCFCDSKYFEHSFGTATS